jgi:hypothetical protein
LAHNEEKQVMPITSKQIGDFLGRYREFAKGIEQSHFAKIASDFDRIKPGIKGTLDRAYESDRKTALNFNIFELLGVERVEAKHSRLLADLLDPRGSHGQGPFFLNNFLRFCESKVSGFPPALLEREVTRSDFVFVKTELYSGYGRPDIVAVSHEPAFALIIENKIDAGDQDQQLERYWRLLERGFAFTGRRRALLYLTPSGRLPDERKKIPADVRYSCISYATHINEWLRSCIDGRPSRLQQIMMQYAEVVAQLVSEQELRRANDEQQP